MKRQVSCLLLVVAGGVAVGCSADQPVSVSASTQAIGDGLELEVSSPTAVAGQYAGETGVAHFKATAVWGDSVEATLEVGASRVDVRYAAREGENGTVTFSVAGKLEERDRATLAALASTLYDTFPYEGDPKQPTGALLRTFADYSSSWSIGPTEKPILVSLPARPRDDRDPEIPRDPTPPPPPQQPPPPPLCNLTGDDDGVSFLGQCCNGGTKALWQHDANNHCFVTASNTCGSRSITSGDPLATDCPGRCGSGCFSVPFYTQDCFDHDLCLMHHPGPGGLANIDPTGSCGDELIEALDDFAFIYGNTLAWSYTRAFISNCWD